MDEMRKVPVFGVTGWKNSGKTTLVTKLVSTLVGRGMNVSTIKHAHHKFDIDVPGTDSHSHREAGAKEVAIVSGLRWAIMHELGQEQEPSLHDMLGRMSECDIVIVEGFKTFPHPKIEVRRAESFKGPDIAHSNDSIVAIASKEKPLDCALPHFDPDAIDAIADFVLNYCELTV